MSRHPAPFRQVDLVRALKAAAAAGLHVGRVEIDPSGKIIMVSQQEAAEPVTDFDRWKASHARKA